MKETFRYGNSSALNVWTVGYALILSSSSDSVETDIFLNQFHGG